VNGPLSLADALGVKPGEVVALVGGGGKSTAMFRLAREVAEAGGCAITTTTTHIFGAQTALEPATNRAGGVSLDVFSALRAWFPDACVLNEADGSRTRPFKAPAGHEPVIPRETTLVIPMVGADIFGKPLDEDHVHRPALVAALSGAPLRAPITPDIVARVLAHPEGGRKGVPPGARVVVLINKVERLPDRAPARETAERLLREPAIHSVLLTSVREDKPVLEVYTR